MTPIYLKFPDAETAAQALAGYEPAARDDVGVITIGENKTLDGWHVNLIVIGDLPEALRPYVVVPKAPARRFAGF